MGQVFGINGVKEPVYASLWQAAPAYEIRRYPAYFIAQVPCTGSRQASNQAFRQLADYIGVFGTPKNTQGKQYSPFLPLCLHVY